jgi:hypothetical protein
LQGQPTRMGGKGCRRMAEISDSSHSLLKAKKAQRGSRND